MPIDCDATKSRSFKNKSICNGFDQKTFEQLTAEKEMRDRRKLSGISRRSKSLVAEHISDVEGRLLDLFGDSKTSTVDVSRFIKGLTNAGIRLNDPRLKGIRKKLLAAHGSSGEINWKFSIDSSTFMHAISENLEIIVQAFTNDMIIPDFKEFCHQIESMYNICKELSEGKKASYIPQLARANIDHWGCGICTVDGQRFTIGDVNVPFTIQSCCKPLMYALACDEHGPEWVHQFVGMEPSGRYFNELCLDYNNKPHNPMINAGAIMVSSMIKPDLSNADRFDYIYNRFESFCGGEHLGFNNAVFLSERENADRNFALAYFMRENQCFPKKANIESVLDFYFQICSLEITVESGAVIAATLANGGINPVTDFPVLDTEAVRNTLTLMHSCGMYNYSGQFAFKVGLPAKSGVSGCVLLVIPGVMGVCLWSPPLDVNGNSFRAVRFCRELVNAFSFHHFDNLKGIGSSTSTKSDPRQSLSGSRAEQLFRLLFSTAAGDIAAIKRQIVSGTDTDAKDYDGRTALHVATSEGHFHVVKFLLESCKVNPAPHDRWGRTPLDDARSFNHRRCIKLIETHLLANNIPLSNPNTPEVVELKPLNGYFQSGSTTLSDSEVSMEEDDKDGSPLPNGVTEEILNGVQQDFACEANCIPSIVLGTNA